jgi:Fur family iron response transcriptional regulator
VSVERNTTEYGMTEDAETRQEGRRRAARWLAEAGLRPTRQRIALAELLVGDGRDRHVTAESLYEAARGSGTGVSLATVYNTLRSFTRAGLITEIKVDATRSYFDTDTSDHAHFYWEEEGRVSDVPRDAVRFEALPDAPEGAEITKVDVVIRLRAR